MQQPRVLSTDPNAGQPVTPRVLSLDPLAGQTPEYPRVLSTDPNAPDERTWLGKAADVVVPAALRIGGEIVGGVAGSFTPLGPGAGTVVGGAAGSAAGETAAEGYEVARGLRRRLNPTQIAVQGALGAVPVVGRAGSVVKTAVSRGAQGAVLGGASAAMTDWAEGKPVTLGSTARGAAVGAVLGGAGGAAEAKFRARRARPTPKPPVETPDPRVDLGVAKPIPPRTELSKIASGHLDRPAPASGGGKLPADAPRGSDILPDGTIRPPTTPAQAQKVASALGAEVPPAGRLELTDADYEKMAKRFPEHQREDLVNVLREHRPERDVQSNARTEALAQYIRVDPNLKRGVALNAVESHAYANALRSANEDVSEIAAKIKAGQDTPLDHVRLQEARARQTALTLSLAGADSEAGRALQIRKKMAGLVNSQDDIAIRAFAEHPELRQSFNPDEWAKLTDDIQRMDYIKSKMKLTLAEWAQGIYYANILSGPKTFNRNFLGTASNVLFNKASLVPALGYDIARSAIKGTPRTIYASEVGPQLMGAMLGVKQGLYDAWFTMRHDYSPSGVSSFDLPRLELPGGGKNPFNYPGRILEATDQLWLGVLYNSELYGRLASRARQLAHTQGLRGEAFQKKVTEILADWKISGGPKDLVKEAKDAAARMAFREESGKNVQALLNFKQNLSPPARMAMNFVIPFVKVPANVMRQAVENVAPIATAQGRAAINAGGRLQAEARGRQATAMAALGLLAYYATQGKISGSGPKDPEQRAALMEAGWRPNSIKIGDSWRNYELLFQGVSTPLFAIANAYERLRDGEMKPGEWPAKAAEIALGTAGSVTDQSFISGMNEVLAALNDPERNASRYAGRLIQSAVPFSGLQRNIAQAIDPVVRETPDIQSMVSSITPGLSQTAKPRLTRFGEPVTRKASDAFNPVPSSPVSTDPVIAELGRLGVMNIGKVPTKLEKTRVTPAYTLTLEEQQMIGRAVKASLEQLFRRQGWKNLDDDRARQMIDQVVRDARANAALKIRVERRRSGGR